MRHLSSSMASYFCFCEGQLLTQYLATGYIQWLSVPFTPQISFLATNLAI